MRRVRAGGLPAYRIASNALRFRADEIEAFLERSAYESERFPQTIAADLSTGNDSALGSAVEPTS